MEGFSGEDHEVDLLKVIFRSTTMLEGVTLKFSRNVSPECSVYKELPSILDAHPSVKFNIYSCYHFQESSMNDSDLEILEVTRYAILCPIYLVITKLGDLSLIVGLPSMKCY